VGAANRTDSKCKRREQCTKEVKAKHPSFRFVRIWFFPLCLVLSCLVSLECTLGGLCHRRNCVTNLLPRPSFFRYRVVGILNFLLFERPLPFLIP
jgi:hypothetical protein